MVGVQRAHLMRSHHLTIKAVCSEYAQLIIKSIRIQLVLLVLLIMSLRRIPNVVSKKYALEVDQYSIWILHAKNAQIILCYQVTGNHALLQHVLVPGQSFKKILYVLLTLIFPRISQVASNLIAQFEKSLC